MVIVIIGISLAAISLSLGVAQNERQLKQQAQLLVKWIEHIQKTAAITGTTYSVVHESTDNSLYVQQYHAGEWQSNPGKFKDFFLGENKFLEIQNVQRGLKWEEQEYLRFYPNLEYSPFKLFYNDNKKNKIEISGDGVGSIIILDEADPR